MNQFTLVKQASAANAAANAAAKGLASKELKRAGLDMLRTFGSRYATDLSQKAGQKGAQLTVRGLKAVAKRLGPKPTLSQRAARSVRGVLGSPTAKRIGTFGAGAAGIAGGVAAIDALRLGLSRKVSDKKQFANVLKENPALMRDREHAHKVFKTLKRFNPEMAADPLVAGSFLKRSLQYKDEGIQPMDVKTLTEIGKNMRDRGGDSFLGKIFGDVATAKGLASMAGG